MLGEETDSALDEEEIEDADNSVDEIDDDEASDTGSIIPETVTRFADKLLSGLPPRLYKFFRI